VNSNRLAIRRLGAVAAIVAVVGLAACGSDSSSDDDSSATTAAGAAPTTAGDAATTAGGAETTMAPETTASGGGGGIYGNGDTTPPASTAGAETTAGGGGGTAAGATVATTESDLGTILVDGQGRTLYAFTPDSQGTPTCLDSCAQAWPPALVEGEITVGEGLDDSTFSTVENPTGGMQLKAGDFPLYLYAQDTAPGDVNGQGVGGVWFVVAADGSLIEG
jgi:predicted lipoprotein with Yx(FWY)xxD motif